MARGLKFRIYEVEGSYYPCSENKGADQLRGYREADLRLCFRICKKPVFSRRGSDCPSRANKFYGKGQIENQTECLMMIRRISNSFLHHGLLRYAMFSAPGDFIGRFAIYEG